MKTVSHIVNQLKAELNEMGNLDLTTCLDYENALALLSNGIHELKTVILSKGFSSIDEEIYFFKDLKPFVMSRYLFSIFAIQYDNLNFVSNKSAEEHANNVMQQKNAFFSEYKTYIIQLKNFSKEQERQFFVRKQFSPPICSVQSEVLLNINFSTFHSEILSNFEYYRMIQQFINQKNEKSVHPISKQFNWTHNKNALVELIYGLHYSNAINNGKVSVKDLKVVFESLFNINLGDIYRAYHEIKQRENRTQFIESIRITMENRIEDDDAFRP